jgi:hypothetical protein
MTARFRLRPVFIFALIASALFTAACTTQRVADEASIADAKKVIPPSMVAEAGFFEGKLLVEANLGRGFRPRMVRPGWKSRNNDNTFSSPFYTDEAAREIAEEEEESVFIPRMRNSTLPPVALRLRVSNLTAAPLQIEFIECKSYLGNFAVRPERITIAPGESGQPDPMVSLLGVSGKEIPVTVTLLLGDKRDTHTLVLVAVKRGPESSPAANP